MTIYSVGEQGATVFDEDGKSLAWLRPGLRLVPGSTEIVGSPADLAAQEAKRVGGYADKSIHVTEDKA